MKGRISVAIMAVLLVFYLVLVLQQAVRFISTGVGVAIVLGVALIVLPLIGFWALGAELLFGFRTQHLVKVLSAGGMLPVDDLPRRASGRPDRQAADAAFPQYQSEVELSPESWASWFRLGLAYDACGDRRRARAAIRRSIALERTIT
jgi:hypothetical protein